MVKTSFDPFSVLKGSKKFGYINVINTPAAKFDMPVGVINGSLDGPTLTVTGGLYPTEYYGPEAASRLYQLIKPEELSGRLITIPIVNMSTFQFRTPMFKLVQSSTSPIDGGNINKFFPGTPNGRPTMALAYKLFDIISKSDYHVDFRGGDLNESHLVHTIYLKIGKKLDETAEMMAKAFGFEYVLPGTPEIGHTSKGTLIYEAMNKGVASIITESGLGYREQPLDEFIELHVQGTMNLLRYFDMIEGGIIKPKEQRFLDMEWQRARAPVSGIFQAIADQGDICKAGDILGLIKDVDGSELSQVLSPIDGIVHCMYPRRVVHVGDSLYTLLKINEETGWI